jgi:hypothetical protein
MSYVSNVFGNHGYGTDDVPVAPPIPPEGIPAPPGIRPLPGANENLQSGTTEESALDRAKVWWNGLTTPSKVVHVAGVAAVGFVIYAFATEKKRP